MYIIFLIVVLSTLSYVLLAKRSFDFFSIAILGGVFYFSPAFAGFAYNPALQAYDPLTNMQYIIFTIYFFIFGIGAFVVDGLLANHQLPILLTENSIKTSLMLNVSKILGVIYICSFLYLVYGLGRNALSSDKLIIMNQLGIDFSIFLTSCLVGLLLWYKQSKTLFILAIIGLLYALFIGYRFVFILSFLSFITYYLSMQGKQVLILKSWKTLAIIAIIGLFLFSYEYMFVAYKMFDLNVIKENIIINIDRYQRLLSHSEPMVVQENLNLILQHNFRLPLHYLVNNLMVLIFPFASKLGLYHNMPNFSQLFQEHFYSGYQYGTATNIWGEMFVFGGYSLLFGFMFLLAGICFAMSLQMKKCSLNLLTVIIPIGMILFFYLQRNDIAFTINMVRNFVLIWIFANLISYIILKLQYRKRVLA